MTLNVNLLLCRRVMRIVTKWLRLGSCRFNLNVAQCRIALLAKRDYEIRRGLKLR